MKVWIDSLLFTSGVPLKTETLRICAPSLILDLRRRTERSHFYVGIQPGQTCLSLEMEQGKVYQDTGRAVKDKNATMKRYCQQMVDHLRKKQPVLIVCYDGMTTSGYIAIIVRWWYRCSIGEIDRDFDYIKEVRDDNDFTSARGKEQREQMLRIKEEAIKIMDWEGRGFTLTKKQKTEAAAEESSSEEE